MLHLSLPNIALPNIEVRDLIAGTSLAISLISCGITLAHCVWLNDPADIAILAQSQSTVW